MVDRRTASVLAGRRFLSSTVFVILVLGSTLGGSMVWVWGEFKEVMRQKEQFTVERQAFNNERVAKEVALAQRTAELDKREFIVQQQEKDYQERLSSLQQQLTDYGVASTKLKQEQAALSEAQSRKDAEKHVQRLMSEFSALGVNLGGPVKCNDADAMTQYNAARAKYSEIRAVVKAHGLKGRYDDFLSSNRESWFSVCPHILTSPFER
jgi:myosin heavy subunit